MINQKLNRALRFEQLFYPIFQWPFVDPIALVRNLLIPAAPVYLLQNVFNSEDTSGFVKDYHRIKVKRMARGERESGRRGGEGYKGQGIRGSNDDRLDPVDLEQDPYRDFKDGFEDLPDPLNDEYIRPSTEEEEDD